MAAVVLVPVQGGWERALVHKTNSRGAALTLRRSRKARNASVRANVPQVPARDDEQEHGRRLGPIAKHEWERASELALDCRLPLR